MLQNQLGFGAIYICFDPNLDTWSFSSELPESEAEKVRGFAQIASVAHK